MGTVQKMIHKIKIPHSPTWPASFQINGESHTSSLISFLSKGSLLWSGQKAPPYWQMMTGTCLAASGTHRLETVFCCKMNKARGENPFVSQTWAREYQKSVSHPLAGWVCQGPLQLYDHPSRLRITAWTSLHLRFSPKGSSELWQFSGS